MNLWIETSNLARALPLFEAERSPAVELYGSP